MTGTSPFSLIGTAVIASAATALVMFIADPAPPVATVDRTMDDRLVAAITALERRVEELHEKVDTRPVHDSRQAHNPEPGEAGTEPAQSSDGELPKMVVVDPTPQQNRTFEELKDLLDQPRYVETLNFDSLVNSEELTSLPKPLQMVIISRAIEKYNGGEVDRETFLGH